MCFKLCFSFSILYLQFDSLARLLQDNWPECDITTCGSGSHDPEANIRCQSHNFHQSKSQEAGLVGSQAIFMEPTGKLCSDAFLGSSDPLTAVAACSSDSEASLSDCAPMNHDHSHISNLSDIPDAELEQMILPFTATSDSDFDPDSFDIVSFIAA